MENRVARQVLLYAGVAVLVLLYVFVSSEVFEVKDKPLDDRGDATATTAAVNSPSPSEGSTQPLSLRMLFAAAVIGIWIILDLVAAYRLRHIDTFIYYLIRVLLGWGLLLALGALIARGHHRLWAALILFGVTASFLGFWVAMLALRKRRLQHDADAIA